MVRSAPTRKWRGGLPDNGSPSGDLIDLYVDGSVNEWVRGLKCNVPLLEKDGQELYFEKADHDCRINIMVFNRSDLPYVAVVAKTEPERIAFFQC